MSIQSFQQIRQDDAEAFKHFWENHGIPKKPDKDGPGKVTPAYNRGSWADRLKATEDELEQKFGAGNIQDEPVYRGMAMDAIAAKATQAINGEGVDEKTFNEMRSKGIIDSTVAENSTPLSFDPEVLGLLKETAPLAFDRLTRRGVEGYEAVFNRVDDRDTPLGKVPESVATRLQDYARGIDLTREDVPLTIYADTAEVSDFAAQASSHYMDLSDLAISNRMGAYAQFHEQEILYGDPDVNLEGGSPLGPQANLGLATWYDGAGQSEDKTTVTSDILEDIKWEIRQMLQGPYAIRPQDLELWMSWSLFNFLEDEFTNVGARFFIDSEDIGLNFGDYNMNVGGISVIPSHSVDEQTYVAQDTDGTENDAWDEYEEGDTGYAEETVGSPGDCFIVNTSTAEFRELAPLSTFPLSVRGAADEVAMVEYGAMVELSGGNFGKYLSNYADGALAPSA